MDPINVLIVDDEALLREGLQSMLVKEKFVKKIYHAGSAEDVEKVLGEAHINLVLLDIRLRESNAIDLIPKILDNPGKPAIIAVTGLDGVELIINLLKAGVKAIVYKLNGYNEIIKAVHAVLRGDSYFPENILKIIQSNAHRWEAISPMTLTKQEKDLLKAIATGATTKEIGPQLKMTAATAETYRTRLMKKLGVVNTAAMLAYAYRNGIL